MSTISIEMPRCPGSPVLASTAARRDRWAKLDQVLAVQKTDGRKLGTLLVETRQPPYSFFQLDLAGLQAPAEPLALPALLPYATYQPYRTYFRSIVTDCMTTGTTGRSPGLLVLVSPMYRHLDLHGKIVRICLNNWAMMPV